MVQSAHPRSPAQRRVTLQEVARKAGLSPTTISIALNRAPEDCHLSEATRLRAIEVAQELGYRPSWRARALAKKKTFTIGMVYARQAPFMTAVNEAIVTALSETLHEAGYHQLLVPLLGEPDGWREVISPDRLDGCVVLFPMPNQLGQILAETTLPMVIINMLSDLPVPQVLADDHDGTRQLMEHLLGLGHRDIAMCFRGQHPHYSAVHRRQTYERMMAKAGYADRIRVLSYPQPETVVEDFVAGRYRPTAVICHDHVLAIDLIYECARRGVRVPQDLSIAAFNDVYPVEHVLPPLTAVALPGQEMGRLSAELLLERIDNRRSAGADAAPNRKWLPQRLVVRESTAAPRREP